MYLWIKVLHVLAIISWMAGLLYLPRLFVYHSVSQKGSEQSETFKVMERRLYKAIMTPAMVTAWLTGLTMVWVAGFLQDAWLLAKLCLVILLTISHFHLGALRRSFEIDGNTKTQRYYRIINEVPTLLMIGIVVFVIVKPF
jgi:putative membrane protein